MVTIAAHALLFSHSATCAMEPTTLNVTRTQYSPALTGPVAVGFNKTTSIWCSASATVSSMGPQALRDLFWRYSNGTRLPVVDRREPSDHDVYAERYAGIAGAGAKTWRRRLRVAMRAIAAHPLLYVLTQARVRPSQQDPI